MLSSILGSVIGAFADNFLGRAESIWKAYLAKEISKEELRAKMVTALLETTKDIEVSHSETLAKTYASFMQALEKSPLLQRVWTTVVLSQLFVLLWHQFVIPFIVFMGLTKSYPSSGTTVEWAYATIMFCLGAGPVVLRSGPASGYLDKLKSLVGK